MMNLEEYMQNFTERSFARLDKDKFQRLCNIIYHYDTIEKYFDLSIKEIVRYLEELYSHFVIKNYIDDVTVIEKFFNDYDDYTKNLAIKREKLRQFTYEKMKHLNLFHKDFYEDKEDIFYSMPLERQNNNVLNLWDPTIPQIMQFHMNVLNNIEMNRKMYLYTDKYSEELMLKMNCIKAQIFKFELARKGKQSGTVIDVIIDNMQLDFIEIQKEFNKWNTLLRDMIIDKKFLYSQQNSQEDYLKHYHYKFNKLDLHMQYDLPMSVLEYSAHHPELWPIICTKKCRVFGLPAVPKYGMNGKLIIS